VKGNFFSNIPPNHGMSRINFASRQLSVSAVSTLGD
jgi:hypothetical protein